MNWKERKETFFSGTKFHYSSFAFVFDNNVYWQKSVECINKMNLMKKDFCPVWMGKNGNILKYILGDFVIYFSLQLNEIKSWQLTLYFYTYIMNCKDFH